MSKIQWINHKEIDFDNIQKILLSSIRTNQLTNYGPVVKKLEDFFRNKLKMSDDKCVIAVNNGTGALHALVSGINSYTSSTLKYAVQDFTFPSSAQGPLMDSKIIDIDEEMGLKLDEVDDEIDGIIVTNLFGHVVNISKYVEWANKYNKILLFDNATVTKTYYNDLNVLNYGNGSIISLHHTKPLGYGEGGLIIADKKYEEAIRKCINFGFELKKGVLKWDKRGGNYKMSEISAAFILDYLKSFDKIIKTHIDLYEYFLKEIENIEIQTFPNFSSGTPFVNCIPIIFKTKITNEHLYQFERLGITARKYYAPLKNKKNSSDIYSRILCLPCHIDMDKNSIDIYIKYLKDII
jgi:perosamine synthetase